MPQLGHSTAIPTRTGKDDVYLPVLRKTSSLSSIRGALSQSCPYLYDKRRGSVSSVASQRSRSNPKTQVIGGLSGRLSGLAVFPSSFLRVSELPERPERGEEIQRRRDNDLSGTRSPGVKFGADPGRPEDSPASQRGGEYLRLQGAGVSRRYQLCL